MCNVTLLIKRWRCRGRVRTRSHVFLVRFAEETPSRLLGCASSRSRVASTYCRAEALGNRAPRPRAATKTCEISLETNRRVSGSVSRRKRIKGRKRRKETGGGERPQRRSLRQQRGPALWSCKWQPSIPGRSSWLCSRCLQEIKASSGLAGLICRI